MESLSLLASLVSKYVVPKALEKIGEKVGEAALSKSSQSIQSVKTTVRERMQAENMDGVLTKAQEKPTEANLQVLETVLLEQVKTDQVFAARRQTLVDTIQLQSPALQSVLENVRVKGSVEVGDITQSSKGSSHQVIGRNLGAGGDLKIGNITQQSSDVS
ncbi:MAG: Fis family transcriptional regulator [Cyanobacteria bacterium J06598_1]